MNRFWEFFGRKASHDRDWDPTDEKLAYTETQDNLLKIHNIRDFHWDTATHYTSGWITKDYRLDGLSGLDFIVVPFGIKSLMAHTMLRFNFATQPPLVISIEARKERGVPYSLGKALFRQYELFYIFGTEKDLLDVRTIHRKNTVYALPINAAQPYIKDLLLDLSNQANQLIKSPQSYSLLNNNCTTSLARAVNRIQPRTLKKRWQALFPARIPQLLHKKNLITTKLAYKEALKQFKISV